MKETQLLFTAPMVRAVLAGTKTQTRRLIKPRHDWTMDERDDGAPWPFFMDYVHGEPEPVEVPCPYGAPGDRLWVKETWRAEERGADAIDGVRFRADDAFVEIAPTQAAANEWVDAYDNGKHGNKWRPSIFMPRWASRITLEVTDVRVERVQSISDADIAAEGVTEAAVRELRVHKSAKAWTDTVGAMPRDLWRIVWSTINGAESWGSNPWVWVLSFRRVES